MTVSRGASTSLTASVAAQGSFNGSVQLGVSGVPSGMTATLSSGTVAGSGNPTLSIKASSNVAAFLGVSGVFDYAGLCRNSR
jgi:hypothetical protein